MVMVKESADTLLAALVGVTSSGKVPVGSLLSLALAVVHVSMSRWCLLLLFVHLRLHSRVTKLVPPKLLPRYEDFLL